MIRNFFKVAFRNILRNKAFTAINIFGLAIGMACALLIFLFVQDEKSYDKFHKDHDRVYRLVKDFINDDGSKIPDATSTGPIAHAMQRELPEVEAVTRLFPAWGGTWLVKYGDKKITEDKIYRVDSNFLDLLTYPIVAGNKKNALADVNSVVISKRVAKKYFGDENPIGKTLTIDPSGDKVVTAVIDVPSNSHLDFDFLMSWNQLGPGINTNWGGYNNYTYVRVKPGTNEIAFTKKIQDLFDRSVAEDQKFSIWYLQPVSDIHLTSKLKWELKPNSDKLYVYVFTVIGLFIVLIAAINYINLSTAKSSLRAKEIGVRKVSGAVRGSLIKQFLLESVITCVIAAIFAVGIAQLLIPTVNSLTGKQLTVTGNPIVLLYMLLAALGVGLLAGIFPALYLSSFKPIVVLKGFRMNERGALNLRKTLVVLQFTISIVLIIGALTIERQISYIQNTKLGFNKEQVLVVRNLQYLSRADRSAFLNGVRQLNGVKSAAQANSILGGQFATTRISVRGSDKEQQLNFSGIDDEYLETVGIEMKEGRGFSKQFAADSLNNGIPNGPLDQNIGSIVINERAVKEFNIQGSAVGKQLLYGTDGDTSYYITIVGVMKDFHFTSLRNEIKPYGYVKQPGQGSNVTMKLATANVQSTIAQLQGLWKQFTQERAFDYVFLDESFATLYAAEMRFQRVFISLVILGILIACLGLLGLATYAAQQRVKEIGIRKTLGASVSSVVGLLSKDFLKLVMIALVIAIPIAWYAMNKWLQDFAYRIDIEWWIFVAAGLVAVLIAFATISVQTIKAAMANPVKSLRTE